MIYDRTDDANPPSLPPESNMPCIHSTNIPSDEVNTLIDKVNVVLDKNEKGISNNPTKNDSNLNRNTHNQNVHAYFYSDDLVIADAEIVVSNEDASSNLNDVADADVATDDVTTADDDIDNAKTPPECENSTGDLDGIQDEYYQLKRKYGSIYDRSDDVSPPPLLPESTLYTMNIPCIHSSILNDGEILVLPLFSLVYRVEQSNDVNSLIDEVNEEYPF